MNEKICHLACRALPLMSPEARAEAVSLLVDLGRTPNADAALQEAQAAFQEDMRPVREAIVSALEAGDIETLRGLRALLPHLLAEVNHSPSLADLLAYQLGKSLLDGLNAKPDEATL